MSPAAGLTSGTWYLLPTPFHEDGTLDTDGLGRLVESAITWRVTGLTVMGVMSEPATLSDAERTTALDAIFGAAAGRVPIIVGCSATSPTATLRRIAEAAQRGAVAAMVAAPALLHDLDLLPTYYGDLRREGGLPILVQDEPRATGVVMPVSILLAAAQAADAAGIKVEDPPTPPKIAKLLARDPSLVLYGGLGGSAALSELRAGAAGTMTGFAFPELLRAIRLSAEADDWAAAGSLFDRILPLITFEAQVGIGLLIRKEVLRRRGAIECARTRGLTPRLSPALSAELDVILDRVGITPGPDPSALVPSA